MKTKPQGRLEKTRLGKILQHPIFVILSNWSFQGMRYMGLYEVLVKLGLDMLVALVIFQFLDQSYFWVALLIAIFLAHSLNWIFNGHFFVLMRYVAPVPKTAEQLEKFVEYLGRFSNNHGCIDSVAIYGSYCRGSVHKFSDLDARVLTKPGVVNGFCGAILCMYLRFVALFRAFPLDIYCYRNLGFRSGLSETEKPVILLDRTGRLTEASNAG